MLKYVTVICVVAALCAGAPQQDPQDADAQILRYDSDVQPDGYSFAYDTGDGNSRQEEGKLDNPQPEDVSLTVNNGQFSYVGPDGVTYTVTFTDGPNGFQPRTSLGQK